MGSLKKLLLKAAYTASVLVLVACGSSSDKGTLTADNPENGPLNVFDVNMYALNKVVCDPFDPGSPGPNDGLIATLHYRGTGQPRWYTVNDFIELGQKSQKYLFLSTLNVPTRLFSLGFPTETGSAVQNDAGENLYEYFALSFRSILKLADTDTEGEYELALLSDDGTVMQVRQADGTYHTVVANDGDHPTRLGCGERITMTRESEVVVKLDYYQGPRYHISLIPMWRKVVPGMTAEPLCGQQGNSLYFDYNNNSAPMPAYNNLLSRGWKPIAAANWHIPAYAIFNPCTTGKIPVISDFAVQTNTEGLVVLTWRTDIPATSQVLYTKVSTGEETLTTADNRLRVAHSVAIAGTLQSGEVYNFRAVSISADYGKAVSDPLRVTVQ